ncbi:MFS transporter [Streptococcus azizii]|uniref:MFS transporter n=1 Tax=Streptococcus azizii TaxID=1579424 RepID=A0AB36JPE9_9STRE|nr:MULTISPECIES: MFS transporter [Streptococcus]MBF0776506.1 MFS transporter [Streptococcus sp. 19428wD3_AN2]ONK26063.1 MFS transporter [Streptococcus azizii]ONK26521.1 MFS transporter [Streptococcus azizii]ONK27388.1 MFS transporter [Streptococcus azizii]TFU82854.1 MFS transporter [Streptococcus sp. AN2]
MFKNNKYNFSAFLLWMAYFCHGIQALTISQNAKFFAVKWNLISTADLADPDKMKIATAAVLGAIAWTGIGKISFLIFSGPLSDRIGRKPLIVAGLLGYVLMFGAFLFATDLSIAKILGFVGGAMTSLFDGAINPALFEMYPKNKATASVLSKALISISSILYPLFVAFLVTNNLNPQIGIIVPFALSLLVLVGVIFAHFPDADLQKAEKLSPTEAIRQLEARQSAASAGTNSGLVKKNEGKFAIDGLVLPLFALTIYSNFYLFQQASKIYAQNVLNMSETAAASVTSLYQLGGLVATIVFSLMMARGIRDIAILVVSPIFAGLAGLVVFLAPSPTTLTIAGIVVGFCSAGGLLQMGNAVLNQFFDTNKGRNTSIYYFVMALGSYIVPQLAANLIASGQAEIIMVIVAVTGIASAALMLFAGTRYRHIFGVSVFSNSKK